MVEPSLARAQANPFGARRRHDKQFGIASNYLGKTPAVNCVTVPRSGWLVARGTVNN